MARSHTNGKRDANEPALRDMLLRLWPGAVIVTMREGQGYDWTVITQDGNLIVENKMPGRYRLTATEREFAAKVEQAGGVYEIWQSPDDVIATWSRVNGLFPVNR